VFNDSDAPVKVGRTFTDAWEQFWPDVLPAAAKRFVATMGLSCTVSEIDGNFSRKSQQQNFHFLVFCALAEGVSLGIGYRVRKKTRMMGLPA